MIYKKFFLIFAVFLLTAQILKAQDETDTNIYRTETIEVDALRGIERLTPITFQNIDREKVERRYWMQDLPMFLNGATSINAYSESGASIGYSYFTIRGFDQRRISILINGIPQNDAEDHQVYWVDLSDITSSAESIQLQRGIGTALYGSSSVGGVINLQTIDYFKRKFINANAGYGDYNSKRYSLEYSSGLIEGGFGLYAKYTRTLSDGYRDQSWSDHWSYFISAGKLLGKNTVIKANLYGGPIKNHLAYLGVTKDYLDGKITGDKRKDRRANFITYPDETDNYNQPHYELVINTQPDENIFISNTFSYINGEGFFNTSFPASWGYDYDYFQLQPFFTTDSLTYNSSYYQRNPDGTLYFEPGKGYKIVRSDIISKLTVNNSDFGWYPKVQVKHSGERGNLVIGGELRLHSSDHFGEITFGNALPEGTTPNYQYYYYNGGKRTFTLYANEIFMINKNLTAMAGVQYVNHRYKIENHKFSPYEFSVNYDFFTPRVGLNYNINNNFRVFGNFSIARREPRLKDIYDAENKYARPNFRIIDTLSGTYKDPLVKPEEMFNYEIGAGFTSKVFKANFNLYLMDFRNEIVNNGQLDNVGQPISGNAGKSIHSGVEFDFELSLFKKPGYSKWIQPLTLSGNINFSKNYFTEYTEVIGADSLGNVIYGNDYSENRILLNPDVIGNLSLNYYTDYGIGLYFTMQHIGKQYLDNSENERKNPTAKNAPGYVDKVINAYTVFNAGVSYDIIPLIENTRFGKLFTSIEFRFKINNIFDTLYETTGNVDSYGTPYWIPAAERNIWADIKLGF